MATSTASMVVPMAASTVMSFQKRAVQVRSTGGRYQGVNTLRASTKRRRSGGLNVQCNAVGEIFKIAAIMNGLTLVGVAVGFVLLRIEAFVEESEE